MSDNTNKIPKIIHYCWFGGKPIPKDLQECIDTWTKMEGYQIIRWDESNCSFDENDFIKNAYADKKLAFISDFYRLKALYEYGGIYLDTDVKINKTFDPLLQHNVFLNFIFDCSVGTAVVGAQKGSLFMKALLDMYDKTVIRKREGGKVFEWEGDKLIANGYVPNNYYFTYYILKNYSDFKLNNKFQDLGDFVIYPKELFEIGKLNNMHYAIHLNSGTWRKEDGASKGFKSQIKSAIMHNRFLFDKLQIIVRKRRYDKLNKEIPFYAYYLAQKNNEELPEL